MHCNRKSASTPAERARQLLVGGQVQGVGFRPFVFRLAHALGLSGWVRNETGRVRIHVQGPPANLRRFETALLRDAPAIAQPQLLASAAAPGEPDTGFRIEPSRNDCAADVHVPPDYFTCPDCLRELYDAADRRYRYPFINCTQCGPRYTLIRALPYDRPNTTMADFALCPACAREYGNPLARRMHAQPLACPSCGPQLTWVPPGGEPLTDTQRALQACVDSLRGGAVVAVKGIGGYHLLCDAADEAAVSRLRTRKLRPHKPLAVMVPATGTDPLAAVRELAVPDTPAEALLASPARPIVLVPLRAGAPLAQAVAPGLTEVGLLLPYSPLHHLLLDAFGGPLVATSGNISGEPVLTDAHTAQRRLTPVADAFLHHDRPIQRPADDAVFRVVAGRARAVRLGRGTAPLELDLPFALERPLLAVGGHLKATVTLAWERRAVVSPHIGDLGTPRSLAVFEQLIADLQALYGVRAERIACDAHPGYQSTRWATRQALPVIRVYHHRAHAAALYAEHGLRGELLAFTWDGTGYGEDGTLWGGEALLGRPGNWRRVASLRPFRLPGGEKAGREPWRSAAALCWETGAACHLPQDTTLLRETWKRGLNAPLSSAAGRLFDAAATLLGLVAQASFEGQGPMWLEAVATGDGRTVPLPLVADDHGLHRTDWGGLLPFLLNERYSIAERAATVHTSLANALLEQARQVRKDTGVTQLGLTGGVFQNRRLTERALMVLEADGFDVRLGERIPVNDGGLSFGQAVEAGSAAHTLKI